LERTVALYSLYERIYGIIKYDTVKGVFYLQLTDTKPIAMQYPWLMLAQTN